MGKNNTTFGKKQHSIQTLTLTDLTVAFQSRARPPSSASKRCLNDLPRNELDPNPNPNPNPSGLQVQRWDNGCIQSGVPNYLFIGEWSVSCSAELMQTVGL